MRRIPRAAALSAAAFLFCAAAGFASPANAQRADAIAGRQGGGLSAPSPRLDDANDHATPDDEASQAPVITHAVARLVPQTVLDRQPGDNGTGERGSGSGSRGLADLVGDYESADTQDEETDCLARAVYWESKGEPLVGQLAVADVIINRAQSGRFASTICGVVRQRSQFSFVHGGYIPPAPQGSAQWHTAVAIARIARQDLAGDAAPQALFFHARYVHPGWRLTRVASVGNHVFYR